jgi:cobalt-zinc-cadmium resistance protein CzcA
VTLPLEVALAGLPNSIRMFSHTQFGLSFIIMTFDDGANAYFARQQVVERLREVELPEGVQPQLAPLSTPIGEIYRYRVKAEGTSSRDLRDHSGLDGKPPTALDPGRRGCREFRRLH